MILPPVSPPDGPPPDSSRSLKIVGLAVIGLIVLCGLCGTAFFILNLAIPFIAPAG